MDDGINSFLEGLGEMEFDAAWPKARLPLIANDIVGYIKNPDQVPLMTESDLIHRGFGPNGYTKPASGLYILREQVLGPLNFDAAFREYSQEWMFTTFTCRTRAWRWKQQKSQRRSECLATTLQKPCAGAAGGGRKRVALQVAEL